MSFKAVDLQFAVHKNPDAGQVQRHGQQKPLLDQADLAGQQVKEAEVRSRLSEKAEKTSQNGVKHSGKDGRGGGSRKKRTAGSAGKQGTERTPDSVPAHPYKGKHIDVSL